MKIDDIRREIVDRIVKLKRNQRDQPLTQAQEDVLRKRVTMTVAERMEAEMNDRLKSNRAALRVPDASNYRGSADREIQKEWARYVSRFGGKAVTPRTDREIVAKAMKAGFSRESIIQAITQRSPVIGMYPATETGRSYAEKQCEFVERNPKKFGLDDFLAREYITKQQLKFREQDPKRRNEQRFDRLNLQIGKEAKFAAERKLTHELRFGERAKECMDVLKSKDPSNYHGTVVREIQKEWGHRLETHGRDAMNVRTDQEIIGMAIMAGYQRRDIERAIAEVSPAAGKIPSDDRPRYARKQYEAVAATIDMRRATQPSFDNQCRAIQRQHLRQELNGKEIDRRFDRLGLTREPERYEGRGR